MITKIQAREYLRRFDNMDAGERGEVMTRVGEWLRSKAEMLRKRGEDAAARLQNVVQVSVGWNDAECEAWHEGVRLLSAWGVGLDRGMWPDGIYSDSARSAVRWVVRMLTEKGRPSPSPIPDVPSPTRSLSLVGRGVDSKSKQNEPAGGDGIAGQQTKKPQAAGDIVPQKSQKSQKEPQAAKVSTPLHTREGQGGGSAAGSVLVPARPKHIDQYVHLLPVKTQERAGEYGPLMRELDEAREKMRLLMEDGHASASQREQWAKRAVAIEKKAKGILAELDREWEKIVKEGKVKVDALGMAYIDRPSPCPSLAGRGVDSQSKQNEPADGDGIAGQQTKKQEADVTTPRPAREGQGEGLDLRKAGLLRKWLIDLRYGNTEGKRAERYRAKWIEKYRLMVQLGGKEAVTEKVVAAARHYGIDIAAQ